MWREKPNHSGLLIYALLVWDQTGFAGRYSPFGETHPEFWQAISQKIAKIGMSIKFSSPFHFGQRFINRFCLNPFLFLHLSGKAADILIIVRISTFGFGYLLYDLNISRVVLLQTFVFFFRNRNSSHGINILSQSPRKSKAYYGARRISASLPAQAGSSATAVGTKTVRTILRILHTIWIFDALKRNRTPIASSASLRPIRPDVSESGSRPL